MPKSTYWDQVGYWAVKIVTGVPDAVPIVGSTLVVLLRGDVSIGQITLTRLRAIFFSFFYVTGLIPHSKLM